MTIYLYNFLKSGHPFVDFWMSMMEFNQAAATFFGDRVLISIGLSGGGFFGGKNIHPTLNVFDIVLAGFTMSTDEMLTFFISSSSVLRHRLTLLVTTPTM